MKYDDFGFIRQVEDQQESSKELKAEIELLKSQIRRLTYGSKGNQNNQSGTPKPHEPLEISKGFFGLTFFIDNRVNTYTSQFEAN